MSCNGCRVLRKGCSEGCVLRHCLRWIDSSEAQAHATLFVTKFFGRAGLTSFINGVPENERPALFQSLLYEACGRTVNPVYGAVGLLSSGNWGLCQAAVETVLKGGSLKPVTIDNNAKAQSNSTNPRALHQDKAVSVAPLDMPASSSRSSLHETVRLEPEQSAGAEINNPTSGLSSSIEGKTSPQMKRLRESKHKEDAGEKKVQTKNAKSSEDGDYKQQYESPKRVKSSSTRPDKHLNSEGYTHPKKAIPVDVVDQKPAPLAMTDTAQKMAAKSPKIDMKDRSPIQGEMMTSMARSMNKWPGPLIEGLMQGAKQGQCSFSEEISSLVSSYENASSDKKSMNIDLNLTLKPQHLTPNISLERRTMQQRVPSPSADSEGSVTGLYRSTAESPKEEPKLLHLLL